MGTTASQHNKSQRERDEAKYLRQMEGSRVATWNYIKGCRFASSNFNSHENRLVILFWLDQFFCKLLCQEKTGFNIFFSCCHVYLHGVGQSKHHWLIFSVILLALYGRCPLWNVNLIPWVASGVNVFFPLQIPVEKYLRISY